MKPVNSFLLGEVFCLLERIELIDRIQFEEIDPDDEADVRRLSERFIRPVVEQSRMEARDALRWAIEYYSASGSAPFQLMRDRCQELSLPDSKDWGRFFRWIGQCVFGEQFLGDVAVSGYSENLDEDAARLVFTLPRDDTWAR